MGFTKQFKNLFRKRRYKPLYKKFINLRCNVQYRRKIFLISFKKLKWKYFLKTQNRIKKNLRRRFVFFDHSRFTISKFFKFSFKRRYERKLRIKKTFNLFYGTVPKQTFKNFLFSVFKKRKEVEQILLKLLESRLDVILYRAHFSLSIRKARQLISHGHIYVNKQLIKSKSYKIKPGDLIEVNPKLHNIILNNILMNHFWPIPPRYLQINYKILQIFIHENIKLNNLESHFPFKLNLNEIIIYYKH